MKMPSALTPYTETLKLVLAVVVGCLLLWGGQTVVGWYKASEQNEARGRTMVAAGGIVADGDAATEARADADNGTATARGTFEDTLDEDYRNEPATAVRDTGVVPASRLRAFQDRRLERERITADRLRRAGIERAAGLSAEESSER